MQRIGIFGGSFNPIHIAHLIVAERFVEALALDRCVFVPAARSPFKEFETSYVSDAHRLEMVRLAIAENPSFDVSDVEIARGGVSYTVDTVVELQQRYPSAKLFLLVGTDQALKFQQWKRWTEIVQQTQVCIVRRPVDIANVDEATVANLMTVGGASPIWIDAPYLAISSTDIRRRVHALQSIRYVTPASVISYINHHGLYNHG
jgi:nicotinate-nucleotide adenylyltransferase